MKPAPFEYAAPHTVAEAVALLAQGEEDETKILAGGQSLVPMLNMRLARPQKLIDVTGIEELCYLRELESAAARPGLAIGALMTKRDLEDSPVIRERQPLLHASTVLIGHPQIRNRGTIGGSMAQADPAAEYPAVALALDMELVAVGPEGERCIPAEDFFITYLTTALEPNELLTEIRVPDMAPGTGWSIQELSRRHGDFAMAGMVVTLRIEQGVCADTRIVHFGVLDRAARVAEAEAEVDGQAPEASVFERAAARLAEVIDEPTGDVHGSSEYRRDMAGVLAKRGLAEAAGRAGAGG